MRRLLRTAAAAAAAMPASTRALQLDRSPRSLAGSTGGVLEDSVYCDSLLPAWTIETSRRMSSAVETTTTTKDSLLPHWSLAEEVLFEKKVSAKRAVRQSVAMDVAVEEFGDEKALPVSEKRKKQAKSAVEELAIDSLGVSDEVVDALAKRGITHLFPIQRAVLEPAMKGCDLIARAKTGTGKTLAFGIPIIRHIVNENEAHQDGRSALFVLFSFEASYLGVSPRVCNVIDGF
jgi:hypothetical protein